MLAENRSHGKIARGCAKGGFRENQPDLIDSVELFKNYPADHLSAHRVF